MHDPATFEARLADAYQRYVAPAPVEVDPVGLARSVVAGTRRQGTADRRGDTAGRRILLLAAAVVALVSLALAGLLLTGSRPHEPALPSATATTAPSVAAPSPASPAGAYQGEIVLAGSGLATAANPVTPIAVTLADGRVLIAGGGDVYAPNRLAAQVWDPATGASVAIPNAVNGGGAGVLLRDGRVLLIAEDQNATASFAYLFDPTTMTFEDLLPKADYSNAPPFGVRPSLALLRDGRVLVAGGRADVYKPDLLASALLFDPASGTFTPTGSMATPRWYHAMTTLPDGRVLVAGGDGATSGPAPLDGAEIYDPGTGRFTSAGRMRNVRGATLAVALPDGRVALFARWLQVNDAPGLSSEPRPATFDTAGQTPVEIFDPAAGALSVGPGSVPGVPDSATALRDGRVLVTGANRLAPGDPFSGWRTWAAVYDPETGTTSQVASPPARLTATTALPDGRVVLAGGLPPTPDTQDDTWTGIEIFR